MQSDVLPKVTNPRITSPRITMLSKEEALQRGRELGIDDYVASMNLFRVLLKHPEVAKALNNTIMTLVSGAKVLDARLRELIIMRVSWLARCDYEWTQHWQAALFFGLSESELIAVRDWQRAECFTAQERALFAATDDVLSCGTITAENWQQLADYFSADIALIEIVTCIGNWHMFAQLLCALDIPLEDTMTSWPPDGRAPSAEPRKLS